MTKELEQYHELQGCNKCVGDNLEKKKFLVQEQDLPDILTVNHIAAFLHLSNRKIYELLRLKKEYGGIPNFRIGTSKRVNKEDFVRWIEERRMEKEGDR